MKRHENFTLKGGWVVSDKILHDFGGVKISTISMPLKVFIPQIVNLFPACRWIERPAGDALRDRPRLSERHLRQQPENRRAEVRRSAREGRPQVRLQLSGVCVVTRPEQGV